MKKGIIYLILTGTVFFAAYLYASSNMTKKEAVTAETESILISETKIGYSDVQKEIAEDEAEINEEQREINAELEEARIEYQNKPSKLAEKESKYKRKQEELDFERKELQFKKDNIDLLAKIKDKRYQIHVEKRKGNPDWSVIEKLTSERNQLEAEYDQKKSNYLYR